jgi:hypothetical protein
MARNKKSKRPNLPQETLERARAELRGDAYVAPDETDEAAPMAITAAAKAKPSAASIQANRVKRAAAQSVRRIPTVEDLLTEYHYVLRDLRNLAVLAGVLLVAIAVLSLVLGRISG